MEQTRPGQYFDITETEKGTYILNANDLNMAPHLDKLAVAGVDSIKIEGRAKSHYYVAVTANAYRGGLDSLQNAPQSWQLPEWVADELNKISHRTYSTGFFFGTPKNAQTHMDAGYIRDYAVGGVVTGYENGRVILQMKNKFLLGQIFDCLEPGSAPFLVTADEMYDENDSPIDTAPHPMMTVKIPFSRKIKTGSLLRMAAK